MSAWDGDGRKVRRCCVSCRRGTPAFGETKCGKPECPCHWDTITTEREIAEMNGVKADG